MVVKTGHKKKPAKEADKKAGKGSAVSGKKDITKQLEALEGVWNDAEEKAGGEVPDGKYAVRIEEATIGNAKTSGRLQVNWTLKIVTGDYKDRNLWKHDGIEDAEGLSWLRTALARLGVDWPESQSDLPEALEGLVGTFAQVTCKTKAGNDIQNTYFDKALDDVDEDDTEATEDDTETTEDADADDDTDADAEGDDAEEAAELSKGDRVTAEFDDGETYAGKIIKITDDGALVLFDDGEKVTFPLDELTAEETEDDAAEDDGEADADSDDATDDDAEAEATDDDAEVEADEPKVTMSAKAKVTPADKKGIEAVAKKWKFDPDEYEKIDDLGLELAEYLGVSGAFKDWASLIKKLVVAKKK